MYATPSFQIQRAVDAPEGIHIRPLTFIDTVRHAGTLVEAMRGRDVSFRPMERSRLVYAGGRWVVLPVYFQLGCSGYGAFKGDRLAGMVYLRGWRQAIHVDALAVHPDFRRRGVGRSLMHVAEDQARRLGRRWVTLRVTAGNEAAVKLYEGEGFRRAHHRVLRFESGALAEAECRAGDKGVSLRPLAGPAATTTYERFVREDLLAGDAWAADVLSAQMATRLPGYGRRRWACLVDGRAGGYLSVRARPAPPKLFLASLPEWWGTAEERILLCLAAGRLTQTPGGVKVQLASTGHHEAAARALADWHPSEQVVTKMTMLKSLGAPPEGQRQGGRDGR